MQVCFATVHKLITLVHLYTFEIKSQSGICIIWLICSHLLINILMTHFSKVVNLCMNERVLNVIIQRYFETLRWGQKKKKWKSNRKQLPVKKTPCAKQSPFPWKRISTPSTPLQLSKENNGANGLMNTWINEWTDMRLISTARAQPCQNRGRL